MNLVKFRPSSVSFLICTSGKEYHSQAGWTSEIHTNALQCHDDMHIVEKRVRKGPLVKVVFFLCQGLVSSSSKKCEENLCRLLIKSNRLVKLANHNH